jgi:hypothetical protein
MKKEEAAMSATQCIAHDLLQGNPENSTSTDLQDQTRTRAYEIYEQRGRQDGFAERDWLEAEAEILASPSRDVQVSTTAREKAAAFAESRRQAALSRAARSAEKARFDRAGV